MLQPSGLAKGFEYLLTAAKLDHADACVCVGACYAKGVGVRKSAEEAAAWYVWCPRWPELPVRVRLQHHKVSTTKVPCSTTALVLP